MPAAKKSTYFAQLHMSLNLIAGAIIGALYGLLIFGLHFSGVLRTPLGEQLLIVGLLVQIIGLIWALGRHRARTEARGEEVPFALLMGAGLMISLIAGLVLALSLALFTSQVDPGYLEWIVERAREDIEAQELPAEVKEEQLQRLQEVTPTSYAMQGMMGSLTTGFFLTLMISAFLRLRLIQPRPSS